MASNRPHLPTKPIKPNPTANARMAAFKEDILLPREARFVEEYLIDHNGGRAIRAISDKEIKPNVSYVMGSKMLALPRVRKAIEAAQQKLSDSTTLTKPWTIQQARRLYAECMGVRNFSAAGKALELIARLHGHIVEPARTVRVITSMADLSDAELDALEAGQGPDIRLAGDEEAALTALAAKETRGLRH